MLDENFPLIKNPTEGSSPPASAAMLDRNLPLIKNATEGSSPPASAAMLDENAEFKFPSKLSHLKPKIISHSEFIPKYRTLFHICIINNLSQLV